MNIKNHINTLLAISLLSSTINATTVDYLNSLVAAPALADTVIVNGPLVIGVVNDVRGKAIRNKGVSIYIDKRLVGVVPTNTYGVWSYIPGVEQSLDNGAHMVQANVQLAGSNNVWTQASLFYVDASRKAKGLRSGNVNADNSAINFPFDGSYVNLSAATIVGSLENTNNYAVSGETVHISINGVNIATVTSDSNGVFSYQVSNALDDGNYTVGAHCVQSNVDLTTNSFTVDTVAPDAPTISTPLQSGTETSSTVIVTGTTEAYATITTYLDGNPFGDVSYADDSGNWSIQYDDLVDGSHSVAADATDLAGNTGSVSGTIDFTVSA